MEMCSTEGPAGVPQCSAVQCSAVDFIATATVPTAHENQYMKNTWNSSPFRGHGFCNPRTHSPAAGEVRIQWYGTPPTHTLSLSNTHSQCSVTLPLRVTSPHMFFFLLLLFSFFLCLSPRLTAHTLLFPLALPVMPRMSLSRSLALSAHAHTHCPHGGDTEEEPRVPLCVHLCVCVCVCVCLRACIVLGFGGQGGTLHLIRCISLSSESLAVRGVRASVRVSVCVAQCNSSPW